MKDESLKKAIEFIEELNSKLNLKQRVKKEAINICKKVSHSYSIELTAIASIYIACRVHRTPRTLREMSGISEFWDEKMIGHTYRKIIRQLNIKVPQICPIDIIEPFANDLKLSNITKDKAIKILELADKEGLTNSRSPLLLVGSALYIAGILTNDKKTLEQIANIVNITTPALRIVNKELISNINFLETVTRFKRMDDNKHYEELKEPMLLVLKDFKEENIVPTISKIMLSLRERKISCSLKSIKKVMIKLKKEGLIKIIKRRLNHYRVTNGYIYNG